MATQTYSTTKVEALAAPITLPGATATYANVTRYYSRDTVTNVSTEYGVPSVEPLWGKNLSAILDEATAELANAQARVTAAQQKIADIEAL